MLLYEKVTGLDFLEIFGFFPVCFSPSLRSFAPLRIHISPDCRLPSIEHGAFEKRDCTVSCRGQPADR